jgi:ATP-dependent helicase HrpB
MSFFTCTYSLWLKYKHLNEVLEEIDTTIYKMHTIKMKPVLPIDSYIHDILKAVKENPSLVLTASPGAGKSTRLPPTLLSIVKGKVLVLEPRRVAAIAACYRIAEENDWTVGKEVGYQVRFDNKTSNTTRLIFMTEALLARQMLKDEALTGIDLIVLDEFHERSVHVDLALGLIKEAQDLGHTIKLVIMSATLQAENISTFLDKAPIISVPGTLFPIDINYSKTGVRPILDQVFYKELNSTIKQGSIVAKHDILVFLPGVAEIQRAEDNLKEWALAVNIEIVQLHGSLSLEEQQKALKPLSKRKLILSTNIAESSLTIDGVGIVIDSGLAKIQRYDLKTGFSRLELGRISQSSATQRAGRSARQFEGFVFRMWHKSEESSMPVHETPEIQRIDLTESLLFLSAMGISDFQNFSWFESPSAAALQKFKEDLLSLGAIDGSGNITPVGKNMTRFPMSPRLAKLLLTAQQFNASSLGASLVAIIQERDFVKDSAISHYFSENYECDLSLRIQLLESARQNMRHNDTLASRASVVLQTANQYKKLVNATIETITDDQMIRKLLLHSFKDHLCRRRGQSDRALMVGGRGVRLEENSLVKKSDLFLAILGREGGNSSETFILYACGITKDFLLRELENEISQKEEIVFDEEKQKFLLKKYRAYKDLPIEEPTIETAQSKDIVDKMAGILENSWDWALKQNKSLANWWMRYLYYQKANADFSISATDFKDALQVAVTGESDLKKVVMKDLAYFLETKLSTELLKNFRTDVPSQIQMPSGSFIEVIYPLDKPPYLEVRIQEVFGMKATPKVLGGKVAIVFHLLAPNYRPTQVTSDLSSFWANGYPEVRKELRLRYPKHSWPEDPLTAPAVAKGRPKK